MTKVAFVCVGNAGRSQMATAYAEVERTARKLKDEIEIVTGGIDPGDHIHAEAVEVLREDNIDISNRTPRRISAEDVADAEYVVTMGCDASAFTPEDWNGTAEQWDLMDPHGEELEGMRTQRDEIKQLVSEFFDKLEN